MYILYVRSKITDSILEMGYDFQVVIKTFLLVPGTMSYFLVKLVWHVPFSVFLQRCETSRMLRLQPYRELGGCVCIRRTVSERYHP